jgi:hypothetical protein
VNIRDFDENEDSSSRGISSRVAIEGAVVNSLEENFKFTANHAHYFGSFNETAANMMFQWQEGGVMAVVYPKAIMEEMGATYTYPHWSRPWSK